MAILPICRYADIGDCRYADIADIADIFHIQIHRKRGGYSNIGNIGTENACSKLEGTQPIDQILQAESDAGLLKTYKNENMKPV